MTDSKLRNIYVIVSALQVLIWSKFLKALIDCQSYNANFTLKCKLTHNRKKKVMKTSHILVVCWRFVITVKGDGLLYQLVAFLLQVLTRSVFSGVQPLALVVVDRLGGRRPLKWRTKYSSSEVFLLTIFVQR